MGNFPAREVTFVHFFIAAVRNVRQLFICKTMVKHYLGSKNRGVTYIGENPAIATMPMLLLSKDALELCDFYPREDFFLYIREKRKYTLFKESYICHGVYWSSHQLKYVLCFQYTFSIYTYVMWWFFTDDLPQFLGGLGYRPLWNGAKELMEKNYIL